MKGITPVIATILLLLIAVAVTGVAFTFFSGITQSATEATEKEFETKSTQMATTFTIDSVAINIVYVRNTGTGTLSGLSFYVNGGWVNASGPPTLPAGGVGAYAIDPSQLTSGQADIKVTSGLYQSSQRVILPPITYSIVIQNVDKNVVTIRNNGTMSLSGFAFRVNGVPAAHAGGSDPLGPGATGTFYVNDSVIAMQPDPTTLNITATEASLQQSVCFYCPYYTAYWKFDEGSGGTTADSSGNGITLTINGPVWTTGKYGSALFFNKTYLNVTSAISLGNDWTMMVYINTTTAWQEPILSNRGMGGNIYAGKSGGSAFLYENSCIPQSAAGGSINNGMFHSIVWVRASSPMSTRIYVDGRLAASNSHTSCTPSSSPFKIGWDVSNVVEFFNGTIDDIRIMNINRTMTTA